MEGGEMGDVTVGSSGSRSGAFGVVIFGSRCDNSIQSLGKYMNRGEKRERIWARGEREDLRERREGERGKEGGRVEKCLEYFYDTLERGGAREVVESTDGVHLGVSVTHAKNI
eukprot:871264-Amorphochlora_amoeboformis.AAC.1